MNDTTTMMRSAMSRRALLRVGAGAAAVATLGARSRPGLAQTASPVATPAAVAPYRFRIGGMTATAIADAGLSFSQGSFGTPLTDLFFADAPAAELERVLRETGRGTWLDAPESATEAASFTPLVVETGANVVLIDTGLGTSPGFIDGGGQLIPSLEAVGIAPEDVDTVVFTHAHVDHVAGAVDAQGAPAFPNARYVMAKEEHDFWTSPERLAQVFPDAATAEERSGPFLSILPAIRDRLELVDENGEAEVVPGVRLLPTYGHTPGHCSLVLASEGEQLAVTGDAVAHPLHVAYPDWNLFTDTFVNQADTTRRGLLDRLSAEEMKVFSYHLPFPGLGRIATDGDGFRWEPAV